MRKQLIFLILTSFVCSLALAASDITNTANPPIQKTESLKAVPITVEKVAPIGINANLPDNAALISEIKDKPIVPPGPNQNTILETGDACDDPFIVDVIPFYATGYTGDYADDCDIYDADGQDVIYEMVISTEISLIISLSGSDYDTKLAVYQDECCTGEDSYFLYNDDYDGLQSQVSGTFPVGTYYVIVDAYSSNYGNYVLNIYEPPPPECQQDVYDSGLDFYTSDAELGPYKVYDNFDCEGELSDIGSLTVWGLDLNYNSGWYECEENPTTMEVGFYPDDSGSPDTENPTCVYSDVSPTVTYTGIDYSGYELVQYDITLSEPCEITSGWMSVQGTLNDGNICAFLWGASGDGDGSAYQDQSGYLVQLGLDMSHYIYAGTVEGTGETCDDPLIVDVIPFTDEGYTCDFTDDCDIYGTDGQDVIYEMVIDEEISLILSLSGSDYDTKIAVYQDECCTGEDSYFLYNDDYDGLQSQVEGTFPPGTYYVIVDAYSSNCGNYVLNIYEYVPPVPLCQQEIYEEGTYFYTSDTELGPYVVYDNFNCETYSEVEGLTFWGCDLYFDYNSGWEECEENPTTMEIGFYPDNSGEPDVDNPTCIYSVSPTITYTGIWHGDWIERVQYDVTFDEPCAISSGWISIQGTADNDDSCAFLWGASLDGDANGYQDQAGTLYQLGIDMSFYVLGPVGIDDEAEALPTNVDMLSNYPNPFNAKTTISFSLAASGNVAIDIYDILGRRINKLDLGYLTNNQVHSVDYDASQLATGVYFYSLNVNGQTKVTERFSLLK